MTRGLDGTDGSNTKCAPITEYVLSSHAEEEISRRGLSLDVIRAVLEEPEQQERVREGRIVVQRRLCIEDTAKTCLIRVFVDIDRRPPEVVTAYRTSKLEKYWKEEP